MPSHSNNTSPPARDTHPPQHRPHYHPVGLLYTILRHGRGLPPDEAALRTSIALACPAGA